jgi:hypothetical protein
VGGCVLGGPACRHLTAASRQRQLVALPSADSRTAANIAQPCPVYRSGQLRTATAPVCPRGGLGVPAGSALLSNSTDARATPISQHLSPENRGHITVSGKAGQAPGTGHPAQTAHGPHPESLLR